MGFPLYINPNLLSDVFLPPWNDLPIPLCSVSSAQDFNKHPNSCFSNVRPEVFFFAVDRRKVDGCTRRRRCNKSFCQDYYLFFPPHFLGNWVGPIPTPSLFMVNLEPRRALFLILFFRKLLKKTPLTPRRPSFGDLFFTPRRGLQFPPPGV